MTQVCIGRFGQTFDVDAHTWDVDGDAVKAAGYIDSSDPDMLALARQQIIGLSPPENDQTVVPVTFATDPSQDGYYRIAATSVSMDVNRRAAMSLPWSASLIRVPNFWRPEIEVRSLGKVRENDGDAFTAGNIDPTIALPGDVSAVSLAVASMVSYTTAFGTVQTVTDDALSNARTIYRLAPTDYYDGACRVEQKIDSVWYPVVGRQVKAVATDVRVNNGLLRIAGLSNTTSSGLTMESFVSGSTWGAAKTVAFLRSGANFVTDGPQSVQVLRNRPEECVIRLTFPAANATVRSILSVDVRVRRGHRMADVTLAFPSNTQMRLSSSIALSTATGGYQATADDASSQRIVFAVRSPTSSVDFSFGILYTGSSQRIVFGLGVRETGGASLWGTIGDTMSRWFGYLGETQSVRS